MKLLVFLTALMLPFVKARAFLDPKEFSTFLSDTKVRGGGGDTQLEATQTPSEQ